MGDLEELQKSIAELTDQLAELKLKYDAQTKTLSEATRDLTEAREANAILVSRIPSVIEKETIEPEDDRSPEERLIAGLESFVDAVYFDRFAKADPGG